MQHFLAVCLPILYFSVASFGTGAFVLYRMGDRTQKHIGVELALAFLLGQAIFGSVLVLFGLAARFTTTSLLLLTLPGAVYGVVRLLPAAKLLAAATPGLLGGFFRVSLPWKLVALCAIALLLSWSAGISSNVEGDGQAFYLTLPKVVAASHRLIALPGYESFSSVGLIAEMQIAALFLLGMPDASPRLFIWLVTLAGTAVLAAVGRRAGLGRRGQIVVVAMVVTSTAIAILVTGKTDFFAASYASCAALYALESWDSPTRRSSLILVGLFTGMALVAKLSYLVAFLPSITILIFYKEFAYLLVNWRSPRRTILTMLAESTIVALAILPAFIPQLIKNHVLASAIGDHPTSLVFFTAETTRHILLTYPLALVFGKYWGQLGDITPLMLAFLPILFFIRCTSERLPQQVIALVIAGLAGLVCWVALFPAAPIPRYFMATLLLLTIPAAWASECLSRRSWVSSDIVAAVILTSFVAIYRTWSSIVFPVDIAYSYMFTQQSAEESARTINVSEMLSRDGYEALNKVAAPGARVFMASYLRFWLRPDLIQTSSNGQEITDIQWNPNRPYQLWQKLYEGGFQYIYMDAGGLLQDALKYPPLWVTVEQIFPAGPSASDLSHGSVYRLTFKNAPGTVRFATQQTAPGAWDVIPVNQVALRRP